MSGIRRYGAQIIATAILAGGTALTLAGNNEANHRFLGSTFGEPPGTESVVLSGTCTASFYWEPQGTASGETFDPEALTAAHKSLPFDTRVRVTNPANGKSVTVRINDRGPYIDGRCLDLSRAAFGVIAKLETGVLKDASYEVLG